MSEDRIALRLKTLEMAAALNAPSYNPTSIMATADTLWAWAINVQALEAKESKTTRNVQKSLARLRASQGEETY